MNIRILSCGLAVAVTCLFQAACQNGSTVQPLPIAGGYAPVEFTPGVKEAAEFAVSAQSKLERKKVKLASITKAEVQVVAGRNYRLVLTVTQGKIMRSAHAVVYQKLDSSLQLTSWEWATP